MSLWGYRVSVKLIGTAVVVLLLGAFAIAVSRPAPREIRLVVRGMAFFLEGNELPNPIITLKAGERVRVVVRNEERGIKHDFAVPSLDAALNPLGWNESSDVTFSVPEAAGVYEYHCRPHQAMMRGTIIVQE